MPKMPLELKRETPNPEYVKESSGGQERLPNDDSQAKSQKRSGDSWLGKDRKDSTDDRAAMRNRMLCPRKCELELGEGGGAWRGLVWGLLVKVGNSLDFSLWVMGSHW